MKEKGLYMFKLKPWICQSSSNALAGMFGAISTVFLYLTFAQSTNALPLLSPPTKSAPAELDLDSDAITVDEAMDGYLRKLMMAESGGKTTAKNPLSSALGHFQFINSTFLEVVDKHFSDEVEGLSRGQILALRTDADFSRRAAIAFNNDNAAFLEARGIRPTFAHMRLSHLLGAPGAAQALRRHPDTHLTKVFSSAVIRANPFMRRLTVAGLVQRAEREVGPGIWRITVPQSDDDLKKFEFKEEVQEAMDDTAGETKLVTASKPAETAPESKPSKKAEDKSASNATANDTPAAKVQKVSTKIEPRRTSSKRRSARTTTKSRASKVTTTQTKRSTKRREAGATRGKRAL